MRQIYGHLMAVVTISIWSSTFIISKIILESLTPWQVLLIRYLIAIVFLTVLYPKFEKPKFLKEELLFAGVGAALVGYFICENSALMRTYSSNVSLIVATIPLMTGIMTVFIDRVKFFTLRTTMGLVLSYAGVAVIIINGNKLEGVSIRGDLLALMAAILFSVYSILMERIKRPYHMIRLTRKVFIYGVFYLMILNLIKLGEVSLVTSPGIVAGLLYLGIVASSLAFIMWNKAIAMIGPTRTNQYIYLVPVVTTVLSKTILKEPITPLTVLGTLAILSGLYLSESEQKAKKKLNDQVVVCDD